MQIGYRHIWWQTPKHVSIQNQEIHGSLLFIFSLFTYFDPIHLQPSSLVQGYNYMVWVQCTLCQVALSPPTLEPSMFDLK